MPMNKAKMIAVNHHPLRVVDAALFALDFTIANPSSLRE